VIVGAQRLNSLKQSWKPFTAPQPSAVNPKHIFAARTLLARAIEAGNLDASYVDIDRKHRGSALNYDLYDAKDGIALYQQRHTVCTKFGNSPAKDYFLVRRTGRKVSVEQLDA